MIVVALLALFAGLAANRWLRPRLLDVVDDEGMAVKDLVGPLLTMTVLLLSFVLVTANGSYGKAESASRGEARALDRSWRPLNTRRRPNGPGSRPPPSATAARSASRHGPPWPTAKVFWFVLATLVLTVTALGICVPRRKNRGQILTLVVITALLTTALVIIRDVDRPFGGVINITPTAITEAGRQAERDFIANPPSLRTPLRRRRKPPPRLSPEPHLAAPGGTTAVRSHLPRDRTPASGCGRSVLISGVSHRRIGSVTAPPPSL
ncbi:hypothetical protein GCM10010372_51050 [Streptomyces tauricus]|uniref:hypothetical protein n=1 Tax=Streptomyces tauricus TaxID=68274 RepID=UPI0019889204|nr:hypothetical protein [Streptomyces tauricus]GHA44895.1 hypothetical protein GCM10010372_51050 [Streptomyces tauricus]